MYCAFCGSQVYVSGAVFCSQCGKPIDSGLRDSQPMFEHPEYFTGSEYDPTLMVSRSGFLTRLNNGLNLIGLWINSKLSKVFRKPLTKNRGRILFIVAAVVEFLWLLVFLDSYGRWEGFIGVQTYDFAQIPFFLVALGLLLYLTAVPRNWRSALQILMWACVVRGIVFCAWNIFVLPNAIPPGASGLDVLLILLVFIGLAPFYGFVIVAPATFVWIRTRKPDLSLSK